MPGNPKRNLFENHERRLEFAERAMRLGAGTLKQIQSRTRLPRWKLEEIRNDLIFRRQLPKHAWRINIAIKHILAGESVKNVMKYSGLTRVAIRQEKQALKKEGNKIPFLGSPTRPPMPVARTIFRYEFLLRLEKRLGITISNKKILAGGDDFSGDFITKFIKDKKNVQKIKNFKNGFYWNASERELEEWKQNCEKFYLDKIH